MTTINTLKEPHESPTDDYQIPGESQNSIKENLSNKAGAAITSLTNRYSNQSQLGDNPRINQGTGIDSMMQRHIQN